MEQPVLAAGLSLWLVIGAAVAVNLLTSLVKNVTWSSRTKNLIAAVLSVVAAGVATVTAGDFEAKPLFELTIYIYGLAQGFYSLILKGTTVNDKLEHAVNSPEPGNAGHDH